MKTSPAIYGIGNTIVDIIFHVSDDDIKTLGLQKGTMRLVTKKQQTELINYLQIENASIFPGGSAPNTIIACNGLGIPSILSGKIGNDKFGELFSMDINNSGVFFQDQDCQISEKTSKRVCPLSYEFHSSKVKVDTNLDLILYISASCLKNLDAGPQVRING